MAVSFTKLKILGGEKDVEKKPKSKNKFLNDNATRFFIVTATITNLITWLLIAIKITALTDPVILHYNAYFGVNVTTNKQWGFFLPAIGLLVLILNFILGVYFKKRNILTTRILIATAFLFNLIIILAIATLIFINNV